MNKRIFILYSTYLISCEPRQLRVFGRSVGRRALPDARSRLPPDGCGHQPTPATQATTHQSMTQGNHKVKKPQNSIKKKKPVRGDQQKLRKGSESSAPRRWLPRTLPGSCRAWRLRRCH